VPDDHQGNRHRAVDPSAGRDDQDGEQRQRRVRLEFLIPARGLIGFRSQFHADTKGTAS